MCQNGWRLATDFNGLRATALSQNEAAWQRLKCTKMSLLVVNRRRTEPHCVSSTTLNSCLVSSDSASDTQPALLEKSDIDSCYSVARQMSAIY